MKNFVRLAFAIAALGGCSGESIGGLLPVTLELTAVDGQALPAPAGNTEGGTAMVAIAGELVGRASGADCTYVISFRPSGGGNVVTANGSISPEPCATQPGAVQNVTLSFTRADLPKGSHVFRFTAPAS